jgi:hypothetical protein
LLARKVAIAVCPTNESQPVMHDGLTRIAPEQLGNNWIMVADHRVLDGDDVRYRLEMRPDPLGRQRCIVPIRTEAIGV